MQSQKNCPIGALFLFLRETGKRDVCFVRLFAL